MVWWRGRHRASKTSCAIEVLFGFGGPSGHPAESGLVCGLIDWLNKNRKCICVVYYYWDIVPWWLIVQNLMCTQPVVELKFDKDFLKCIPGLFLLRIFLFAASVLKTFCHVAVEFWVDFFTIIRYGVATMTRMFIHCDVSRCLAHTSLAGFFSLGFAYVMRFPRPYTIYIS